MLWCFQIFARKFFHDFQNKKKTYSETHFKRKILYKVFYKKFFFKKKGFAQVLPVNGNIYFIC